MSGFNFINGGCMCYIKGMLSVAILYNTVRKF